jgi:hypothetical protein
MARRVLPEATLHRHRQAGIRALAAELRAQESRLAHPNDRIAMDYLG